MLSKIFRRLLLQEVESLARDIYRLLIVVLALLICAGSVVADDVEEIVSGKMLLSTNAVRAGSEFELAVVLEIALDYHIGASVDEALWPSSLTLKPIDGITLDPPQYPKEERKAFGFAPEEPIPVYDGKVTIFVNGRVNSSAEPGSRTISAVFNYQGCNDTQCFRPVDLPLSLDIEIVKEGASVTGANSDVFGATEEDDGAMGSLFGGSALKGFLAVFLLGLGLSLTPCVYPMIPITVGYFGMQSGKKTKQVLLLAALYVFGMALTYSTLGVVAALTGNLFGAALQSQWVSVGIAAVLVLLALSMFGLYEFAVPAGIAAKSQGKSGPIGAFLMGLLFGIVAAPCVGPMTVALLVYVGKIGSPLFGFASFFCLAIGLGMPIFVLATFSGSISRLPKAGMWMAAVKKVFGLLLIGAAIYYVMPIISQSLPERVADLILPVFVAASGIYLGFFEKSLRAQRGLKIGSSIVGLAIFVLGVVLAWPALAPSEAGEPMDFAPYSADAVAQAKADGKPVMIDFSAEWCAACKKLDLHTFTDKTVKEEADRFVVLKADQTRGDSSEAKAREREYNIKGLPTIVFLDSKGKESTENRVVGFAKPKELLEVMRSIE